VLQCNFRAYSAISVPPVQTWHGRHSSATAFYLCPHISVHTVPVKNIRKATHLPDSEPVPSQVPQVTELYIFIEIYLQILSLRTGILFLVEWDLDSGSAADVVGIAKRVRPYPT